LKGGKGYQKDFSKVAPILLDKDNRAQKAKKIAGIINEYTGGDTGELRCVDVGSSSGIITSFMPDMFKMTIGLDIDFGAVRKGSEDFSDKERLFFLVGDSMSLPFADDSIDVIICNQIYEHVPDAKRMIDEIYRVLKGSGFCYFGAGNRLVIKEQHYGLYFLSYLPKWLADIYMRITGKGEKYYEELYTYFGLKALVKRFEIVDFTLKIIKNPKKYNTSDMIKEGSIITRLPSFLYRLLYFAIPSYVWILKKKA
jgi:ubiquinone/menaquinone biosynthesis C-methylase UbiE